MTLAEEAVGIFSADAIAAPLARIEVASSDRRVAQRTAISDVADALLRLVSRMMARAADAQRQLAQRQRTEQSFDDKGEPNCDCEFSLRLCTNRKKLSILPRQLPPHWQ